MPRILLLEIWTGPDAGIAYALPAGSNAVVGRTSPADILLPGDRTVSRRHFALSFDGRAARIEDLGSTAGIAVNGRATDSAVVLDGDLIEAGETTLRARVVDSAPAHARILGGRTASEGPRSAPEEFATPAPESTGPGAILNVLRAEPSPLFAILDAARDPLVYLRIHECREVNQSLYKGGSPELTFVAPYLVSLPKDSPFLDALVHESWGGAWGVFLASRLPFDDLRKHLRRLLMVELDGDDGGPRNALFRFYDPRVLRPFLPTCTPDECASFFGPIDRFYVEDGPRWLAFDAPPSGAKVEPRPLP